MKRKPISCGHKKGTFSEKVGDTDVEYCNVCGQAADIAAWAQGLANLLNAPVMGQLVGIGTVEPEEEE